MSCRCPLVPGLCFICHLCKLFSQHQSFSQLTCKFLKIRNHILYLFCKPEELHVLVMWTKFFCFGSAACHLCVCVCVCVCVSHSVGTDSLRPHGLSPVRLFSRQEYWRGLPFPSPGESSRPRDQSRVPSVYLKQISFTSPSFSLLMWKKRE